MHRSAVIAAINAATQSSDRSAGRADCDALVSGFAMAIWMLGLTPARASPLRPVQSRFLDHSRPGVNLAGGCRPQMKGAIRKYSRLASTKSHGARDAHKLTSMRC